MDRRSFLSQAYGQTRGGLKLVLILLVCLIVYSFITNANISPASSVQSVGNVLMGFFNLLTWFVTQYWKWLVILVLVILFIWRIKVFSRANPSTLSAKTARSIELFITYSFFIATALIIAHYFNQRGDTTAMIMLAGLAIWTLISPKADQKQL